MSLDDAIDRCQIPLHELPDGEPDAAFAVEACLALLCAQAQEDGLAVVDGDTKVYELAAFGDMPPEAPPGDFEDLQRRIRRQIRKHLKQPRTSSPISPQSPFDPSTGDPTEYDDPATRRYRDAVNDIYDDDEEDEEDGTVLETQNEFEFVTSGTDPDGWVEGDEMFPNPMYVPPDNLMDPQDTGVVHGPDPAPASSSQPEKGEPRWTPDVPLLDDDPVIGRTWGLRSIPPKKKKKSVGDKKNPGKGTMPTFHIDGLDHRTGNWKP